jgi:hypothetical protein
MGESADSPPVTTSRIPPCSRTWLTESRRPVSGPAYPVERNPNADMRKPAVARALPTHSSMESQPRMWLAGEVV